MPKKIFTLWKVALFIGLLAFSFLFWLNDHVGHQAKSALLLKTPSQEVEVLAKTLQGFGKTEVFKERTLSSGRLQESVVGQLSEEEQKAAFKSLTVKGGKSGGLVTLTVKAEDQEAAEVLSQESLETLIRMMRIYLGDESEVSLSIIDESIVTKTLVNPLALTLKTFFTALGIFVLLLILSGVYSIIRKYGKKSGITEKLFSNKKTEGEFVNKEGQDERFVPQKLDPAFLYAPENQYTPEIATPLPKASEVIKNEEYGESPESNQSPLQSVSVSMADLPFTFETEVQQEKPLENTNISPDDAEILEAPVPEVTEKGEPTVIEYKRRLNELLAQK